MARLTAKELRVELRAAKAELKPLTTAAKAACRLEDRAIAKVNSLQARLDKALGK